MQVRVDVGIAVLGTEEMRLIFFSADVIGKFAFGAEPAGKRIDVSGDKSLLSEIFHPVEIIAVR